MSLQASLLLQRGTIDIQVDLAIEGGGVVVLLGPNGAGKTSVLRALAGLLPLRGGRVELDGVVLEEPAAGLRVPPERRPVGVVFQDYLLFPHMSVLDNVAFGPRSHGATRAAARTRALALLEQFALADRASSEPATLSGGQAQRVALARALATDPRLLLLDEPLAAMDAGARSELRRCLARHLATFAGVCIVITHDPIEAMTLGKTLVVLEGGRVAQSGPPQELASQPRSRYVAELIGLNLYRGRAERGSVVLADGRRLVVSDAAPQAGEVFAVIPPRAVALYRARPEGSPRNVWEGRVQDLDGAGANVRVHILAGELPVVAEVTPAAVASLGLNVGDPVFAAVKALEIEVYEA